MSQNKELSFLKDLAKRLGLDSTTIGKAQEYYRLCSNKSSLSKINDIPKAIICLDLAALYTSAAIDKELVLKLSTLPKEKQYKDYHHLIETCLGLNKLLSISEICVKLNCNEVKDMAETILQNYGSKFGAHDLTHPQYNVIVVYTACKLKGIKVAKNPFIQESRLKQNQWKQLESKFLEFSKSLGFDDTTKKLSKRKKRQVSNNIDREEKNTENVSFNENNKEEIEEFEDYDVWKARILKEATAALGMK